MGKNYYTILNVDERATPAEIKRAYRLMAKKYHPDAENDNKKEAAEEKFKGIAEAYHILGDEKRRWLYDRSRQEAYRYFDGSELRGHRKGPAYGFTRPGCPGKRCGKRRRRYYSNTGQFSEQWENLISVIREYFRIERL